MEQFGGETKIYSLRPRLRIFLLSVFCLGLIFGSLFLFKKSPSVASNSYYETITIDRSSLNGNTIWGGNEVFDTIAASGGLDTKLAFYSTTNKPAGGLDPSGAISVNGVPYQISWTGATDYAGNDAILLSSSHESASIQFNTVGAYEKFFILGTASGLSEGNYANFIARINYTDGTFDENNYRVYDLNDTTSVSNIYKWEIPATRSIVSSDVEYAGSSSGAPYLQSAIIEVDAKKLVSSIDLIFTGVNGKSETDGVYCGIYAITGMVNVAAPSQVEVINVSNVTESSATVDWNMSLGATSYRVDVALDVDFRNILPNYNNLPTQNITLDITDLAGDTDYYVRVRGENSEGQSTSSNAISFHTDPETTPPTISITANPDLIQIKDDIIILGSDPSGVKQIEESLDNGASWNTIINGDRAERRITENGTYCYRAIDNYDNVSEFSCVIYSKLDTTKPIITVNTNSYVPNTWTNEVVTLTVDSLTTNVGQTNYYYSENTEDWLALNDGVIVAEQTWLEGKKFYFKAVSEAGIESDIVEVVVYRDTTAPTGEIVTSDNSWNQFLNTITFGLFFNETTNFEINATDNLSGVTSIEYIITENKFDTKEAALTSNDWKEANGPVALNPEGNYILYFKLTDRAGNVSIINTDGIVLDTTKSVIEGYIDADHTFPLEDNETYYLVKKIIITDDRALSSIIVNGSSLPIQNNIIELNPNERYLIQVTDQAGNVSAITIQTKTIDDFSLDFSNGGLKTNDIARLKDARYKLEIVLQNEGAHATYSEKQAIDSLLEKYSNIIQTLESAENEVNDEIGRSLALADVDHVTSNDREIIETLIESINSTLNDKSTLLAVDEINTLLIEARKLEDKLSRLDEVAAVLDSLQTVHHVNVDTIKTEDEEELLDMKLASGNIILGNNLTESERDNVEEELKIVNELLAQIDAANNAKNTSSVQTANQIIANGYTIEDKDALVEAEDALERALLNYAKNYTTDEVADINEALTNYRNAIGDIDEIIWDNIRRTTFPTLNIINETEKWIPMDVVGLSAEDEYGIKKIEVSNDGGSSWILITELDSATYDVIENGTYIFRATNEFDNVITQTVTYHNIDSEKPVVAIDAHGYLLGSWTNQPITLTASNTALNVSPVTLYYRATSNTDGGDDWQIYTTSVLILEDTNSKTYEFKAVSEAGLTSDIKSIEVKKDSVTPTGTISEGENSFNAILNTITLGLLFTDTKTYNISATDDRSGIDTVEYLLSDTELSINELKASTDWQKTENAISYNPNNNVHIYYRLIDYAGNITVLGLDGIVYDVPGLSEVEVSMESQNSGYATIITNSGEVTIINDLEHKTIDDLPALVESQNELVILAGLDTDGSASIITNLLADYLNTINEINATEEEFRQINEANSQVPNAESVTSSNKEAVNSLISRINSLQINHSNRLTATEKAALNTMLEELNQKSAVIITVENQLAAIDAHIAIYDISTVTVDDLESLENLRSQVEYLMASSNLTDEESAHMTEIRNTIDALITRIEEVQKAIEEAKEKDKTDDINSGNVTHDDQTSLEEAARAYADALGVFDSNLSLAELFDINNRISIISSALDILDQVAEFEAMVSRLPDPEDVNYDSRLLIKAAEGAYEALSEYGRTLVGPSILAKYRAVVEAYRAYLEGSPLLYAFETLDVFWWGITTLFIVAVFITITRRTHRHYIESNGDSDDF